MARNEFFVKSPSEYKGPFPTFKQPTEIGCFSLDMKRCFHNDGRQLKYLIMPNSISNLEMDLNEGYENAITKDHALKEKLISIMQWIVANKMRVEANFPSNKDKSESFSADFVCYRGLLTELICTVYENRDDWLFCATKFRGTIYLCEFTTNQKMEQIMQKTDREKRMCAWGYKFEQYMVSDKPSVLPNTQIPVNELEEYCIALKGKLSDHKLLFAAEVDGADSSKQITPGSTSHYIELKTSRLITSERQDINFCRHKLIKWWAQSFLIGIPKVICGFRDDHGIVRNVRTFRTVEMPKMAETLWSAAAGMNFCSEFLSFVKQVVVKDNPNVVYKFYRPPGSRRVEWCELPLAGEYQILPDWYIQAFSSTPG